MPIDVSDRVTSIECSPESVSSFGRGTTGVSCVARSYNGFVEIDEDICSFEVTVTTKGSGLFVFFFFEGVVLLFFSGRGAVYALL